MTIRQHLWTSSSKWAIGVLLVLGCASGAQAQNYAGRAYAAAVGQTRFCDTGDLAASGGALTATEASINFGILSTGRADSDCSGVGNVTRSSASVQSVVVTRLLVQILTASLVSAQSEASCVGTSGSSTISGLVFAGIAVTVTGEANQTVVVPGVGRLVINEQVVAEGDITVNALHLVLETGEELILCGCRSAFDCPVVGVEDSTWEQVKMLYRD